MFIATIKAPREEIKAIVGFMKLIDKLSKADELRLLYDEMISRFGSDNIYEVVGYDISTNQHYILFATRSGTYHIGALEYIKVDLYVAEEPVLDESATETQIITRHDDEAEFEEEDDGIPQVDDVE